LIFSVDKSNTYNILKTAGSLLRNKHTVESLEKMSEALSGGNNPRGMQGKSHSTETIALMSLAKTGENNPKFEEGSHPTTTVTKMSITRRGNIIYVYDIEGILVNTFSSARGAAEYFNCHYTTIMGYIKNEGI